MCETADYDSFTKTLRIEGAQIVNGGQTASMIHKAYIENLLRDDIIVPIRTINSDKDENFASNVAINLNNQTKIDDNF